jgi:hypothetical protein
MVHSFVLRVQKLKGSGIIRAAAAHNLRVSQREHGARAHIAVERTALNESLMTRSDYIASPDAIAQYARERMKAAGITKLRKDAVLGLEWIFSLPSDHHLDERAYFADAVAWVAENFGGVDNLLCADIHRDESAPHCHVIIVPLINGKMQGSDAVGSPGKLRGWNQDFHDKVASRYGLCRNERLQGSHKAKAARLVLDHLNVSQDPAMRSSLWQPLRDAIERDPSPFTTALGLELPRAKPKRTMAQIFTSKGKGANHEKTANHIGFV